MNNKELIEAEIENYLESLNNHSLYNPIKYILNIGGKRIRPSVLIDAVKLFGGNPKDAMPLALAVEVFHNFTLMHDDIMDASSLRRGQETVHIKWDVNCAILSGDAMMILAYQLIEKIPEEFQPKIYKAFNKMALWLCEGQQDDMDFEEREEVTIPQYLEMIKNKTSVLIGFCFEAGAIFGKASQEIQDKIYDFGINLGLAFQLQDDYLDLYPKSSAMGKVVGGDLINKKKSIPYLLAIQESNAGIKQKIKELINSQDEARVDKLKTIFEQIQVKEKTEKMIEEYFQSSSESLNSIKGYDLSPILTFAEQLMQREH
ncbi:polyprenyl synthetase family protein [Flavobacteriales bacterium]|nr:polyprenyl synthetase family protein [Flavobacteriales bacterium]